MVPQAGMLATVRNRRAVVASVEPFDGRDGRTHLVRVEYTDFDGVPEETVLWEREHAASGMSQTALPQVSETAPMPAADFDALVRAARWSALTPFLPPDGSAEAWVEPISAPFFGAVQVDDFQLVPLLKALRMPRVSLLLADDVGLGKTIEAGLVLTELLLRRRIRRVLILCPASLRTQWQQEMQDKFSLGFDIIDRAETHAIQRRLGLDCNPWRTSPRIITSYHYLRQPDVLEQFRTACQQPAGAYQLPWDLLVVDEAHNLMPSNFGEDSDLAQMLRYLSPWFEHKLFLTATPHNGYTRCFSGLLEQLDPVRFTQKSEFDEKDRRRIEEIVVRRLKREINDLDDSLGRPRRFAERHLTPLPLYFSKEEAQLAAAFQAFRKGVKGLIAGSKRAEQLAGSFAIEVLGKRLLSCPIAFADSWFRFKEGLVEEDAAGPGEVAAASRSSEEEIADDREREERTAHAAHTIGAWLKPVAERLAGEIEAVDRALAALGIHKADDELTAPSADARLDSLLTLIGEKLRQDGRWLESERLIAFTEYKTTLDYLESRLREAFESSASLNSGAIRVLYGGMDESDRDAIKKAFNDPEDPVRVLLATDAASEGLNLQETARLLLHFEVPWNPARLEQRNGRLDRHGQACDVTVYHFTSEDDADLKFLAHVVRKVDAIREDLGSMGEVFDAAFQRRFQQLHHAEDVAEDLDASIKRRRMQAEILPAASGQQHEESCTQENGRLDELCRHIDLSPETLSCTLEVALGFQLGRRPLKGPDERGRLRFDLPLPTRWEHIIDETLRLPGSGALPALIFDPAGFIASSNGRPVFRPAKDTVLLHLGHPMLRHALAVFARARFPGGYDPFAASRWSLRRGDVPQGAGALILLTVEELAVNELREPFHHWLRTIRYPVVDGELGEALPYEAPGGANRGRQALDAPDIERAKDLWDEVAYDLPARLGELAAKLTREIEQRLRARRGESVKSEKERFRHRLNEVRRAMNETTLSKLEREREKLLYDLQQTFTDVGFEEIRRSREEKLRNLEDEIERRRTHYRELLQQLEREEKRVLEQVLPRRYALHGQVRVFPVAVEIVLPEERR
jgi:superfamily II DNA or RNA helicase